MSLFTLLNRPKLKDRLGFIHEARPFMVYLWSFIAGIVASFATIGFIKLYQLLIRFIYFSPSSNFQEISSFVPLWYFFVILIGGGLLIGLFIYFFIPAHGHGHGVPHVLYAYRNHTYIPPQDGLTSTAATTLSLSIGTSVGRELPAIYLSCSAMSWLCQAFRLKGHAYRIILASAVAASLATSLHSTFVGFFFAIEIICFSLTVIDLLPIMVAVFTGVFIREYLHNILPPFILNLNVPTSGIQIINFIILGVLCGILAFLYVKSLTTTIKSSFRSRIPKWLWPMFGGVGISLLCIHYPEVLGLGFWHMSLMLEEAPNFLYLLFLTLAKFLAILFSLGFGFSGGVFTPTVYLGLCLGSLFAAVLIGIYPHNSIPFAMYALAGSAAFTAVALGAPLTMTFLVFEITRSVELTLNVFIIVFVAMLVAKLLHLKSYFEEQYTFLFDH